jgi:hypothetical protein
MYTGFVIVIFVSFMYSISFVYYLLKIKNKIQICSFLNRLELKLIFKNMNKNLFDNLEIADLNIQCLQAQVIH